MLAAFKFREHCNLQNVYNSENPIFYKLLFYCMLDIMLKNEGLWYRFAIKVICVDLILFVNVFH